MKQDGTEDNSFNKVKVVRSLAPAAFRCVLRQNTKPQIGPDGCSISV